MILLINLYKILDFEKNKLYAHVCLSELLILREEKVLGPLLSHWNSNKIFKIFQQILIKHHTYRRIAQKKVQFPSGVSYNFFWLTLYIDKHGILNYLDQLLRSLRHQHASWVLFQLEDNWTVFHCKMYKLFKQCKHKLR